MLRDGSDTVLRQFLDFILNDKEPGGPRTFEKQRSGCLYDRKKFLICLGNLIRLVFADSDSANGTDYSPKLRLLVQYCI